MSSYSSKNFDAPDETRTPPKASVAVVDIGGNKVARMTLEPGWRWSESVKPIAGTEKCQVHHLGVIVSGTMHVLGSDGSEAEVSEGAAYEIQPGHDAWVVGDKPVVSYEFDSTTASTFATKA